MLIGEPWRSGGVFGADVAAVVATATTLMTSCKAQARVSFLRADWPRKRGEERGYGGGVAAERVA